MIKEGLQSVVHISSAHNKGGLPNINIVQISHFSTFFEWKHWFIRYLLNVNKAFVYITDCNLSLIIHALLNAFLNLKGPNHIHSADGHDKLMDFAKDTFHWLCMAYRTFSVLGFFFSKYGLRIQTPF